MTPFADRLLDRAGTLGSPICVGIDPRPEWLVDVSEAPPGSSESVEAVVRWGETVCDAVRDLACAVKLQIAFFEAMGIEGLQAYQTIIKKAHDVDLLVIGDIKRGDIGSTAAAYADAHLNPGGPFEVDAVTVNPLFGLDGLQPFLDACTNHGKGVFLLVKTSNPTGPELQDLTCGDTPHYLHVAEKVRLWGEPLTGDSGYGPIGAVTGATYPEVADTLRQAMPSSILLVPGYGAQGATAEGLRPFFDEAGQGALITASRSVAFAWRTKNHDGDIVPEDRWFPTIRNAAQTMADDIARVLQK